MAGLTLVVLAGGLGSRYGGLKQIDPVGPSGETILEYSVFDARRAGFERVVLVVSPGLVDRLQAGVGRRLAAGGPVEYAVQQLTALPPVFELPAGRTKPWGTAHAVLAAKPLIDGPCAVITADDYCGPSAFQRLAGFLVGPAGTADREHLAMVGYRVGQTLTSHGAVARAVCQLDADGFLSQITERTMVEPADGGARYSVDAGATWTTLPRDTTVSMTLWGLTPGFVAFLDQGFPQFLASGLAADPLGCEYLLPSMVEAAIDTGLADVAVLPTDERWYGVTYQADKPGVVEALAAKHAAGLYPTPLWGQP